MFFVLFFFVAYFFSGIMYIINLVVILFIYVKTDVVGMSL